MSRPTINAILMAGLTSPSTLACFRHGLVALRGRLRWLTAWPTRCSGTARSASTKTGCGRLAQIDSDIYVARIAIAIFGQHNKHLLTNVVRVGGSSVRAI